MPCSIHFQKIVTSSKQKRNKRGREIRGKKNQIVGTVSNSVHPRIICVTTVWVFTDAEKLGLFLRMKFPLIYGSGPLVLRKECATWNERPKGLPASPWPPSWEGGILIKEALRTGTRDGTGGHGTGLWPSHSSCINHKGPTFVNKTTLRPLYTVMLVCSTNFYPNLSYMDAWVGTPPSTSHIDAWGEFNSLFFHMLQFKDLVKFHRFWFSP